MVDRKKNEGRHFIENIDKYRSVLQRIYVYGCFDKNELAHRCGCSKDTIKKAKVFYDACLSDYIGEKNIVSASKSGRPSVANYFKYDRFRLNSNYLFKAYQWAKLVQGHLWKYAYIMRDGYHPNVADDTTRFEDYRRYFSISISRDNECLDDILKKVCPETELETLAMSLCDALALFSRKAMFSVPAYTVTRKLTKQCRCENAANSLWSFMYDNYDRILDDDTTYTIYQAIKLKKLIGYTRMGKSDDRRMYVIPLKIMFEYTSGRGYLLYGVKGSDSIKSVRLDRMFRVRVYEPDIPIDSERYEKILREMSDTLWLSPDLTGRDISVVKLEQVKDEAFASIRKYAPHCDIDRANRTAEFRIRKVDDIKPFIRTLGKNAVISRDADPRLYKEFAADVAAVASHIRTEERDFPVEASIHDPVEKKEDKAPYEETAVLRMFNKFNSIRSVVAEELFEYFSNMLPRGSSVSYSALVGVISDILEKNGFFHGSGKSGLIFEIGEIFVDEMVTQCDVLQSAFYRCENGRMFSLAEDIENNSLRYALSDIEYEYLSLMLHDSDARCLIPEEYAAKLSELLPAPAAEYGASFISRFADCHRSGDEAAIRRAVLTISSAIRQGKRVDIEYKGKRRSISPYRFTYSLREREPRIAAALSGRAVQLNLSRITSAVISEEAALPTAEIESLINGSRHYVELVIPHTSETEQYNVFERCLRLFGSYEKYTWEDPVNNDHVIAVVYYEWDISVHTENGRRIYRSDAIFTDILSLGKHVRVLKKPRFKIPDDTIPYDAQVYNAVQGVYKNLNKLYN